MAHNFTTMTVGNYVFEFNFDTRELRLSWAGAQTFLTPDETIALGDFLFEVLSTQGRPPRILPIEITSVDVKTTQADVQALTRPLEPPEAVKAWQRAKPAIEAWQREHPYVSAEQEEANRPPTVRFVEIRLSEHEWDRLDLLKAAIPDLHEQYTAPESEETHQPVKVLSVRYDTLSQEAINLLMDLQVEYEFRDQLVPAVIDEDEQ